MVSCAAAWIDERTGRAERRQVTVLCCELVDTAASDPEDLAHQLASYRAAVAAIVDQHGGRIVDDVSGNILAVWGCGDPADQRHGSASSRGSHTSGPGAPRSAMMAALDLAALQFRTATPRIALDAGIVIVGYCHNEALPQRDPNRGFGDLVGRVLGDARRLSALADESCVLASDAVRLLTLDAFVFEQHTLPPCNVLPAWTVTACKPTVRQRDRRAPYLVGNAKQRAALDQALAAMLARGRQIVVMTGEAGIGKSTLFRHFRARVNASKAQWIEAICRPEHAHATLQPIRDLLRHALSSSEIAELCHTTPKPLARPLIADLDASDRQLLCRFFSSGDRAAANTQVNGQIWPSDRHQRLVNLLIEMLGHVAARQPTLLAIEDLHWADSETLAFLTMLVEQSTRWSKFGLMLVARRGDQLPKRITLRATIVAVERLSDREVLELLTRQSHGEPAVSPLSPEILRRIALRSDGVPLFAEQLAALYVNTADPEQASAILTGPTSLNLTLAARLDALGDSKSLAQTASVLGRDFDSGVLARMLEMAPEQIHAGLAVLMASGLVTPVTDRPHISHRFCHALVRDAAYASLLRQQRHQLHRRAAETLQTFSGFADANPEAMAVHYTEAGEGTAAARWWRLSAKRALGFSHLNVAVSHLQRGLSLLGAHDEPAVGTDATKRNEELAIRRLLGPCLTMLAGNGADTVIANYRRCLDLTADAAPTPFEVLWGLQGCHSVRGEMHEALDFGERAILAAEASASGDNTDDDERCLLAHRMQGLSRLQAGDIARAIGHYREVERRYDSAKHEAMRFRYASDQGVLATAHWAWAEAVAGNLAVSEQLAEQALARADQLEHPHTSAHVVAVLAARAQTLGQREVAAPLALAARTLAQAHGFTYWSAWSEIILGWHEGATAPETSIARIERAIQDYRRTGAGQALPYAMLLKAEVALSAGLTDLAIRTTSEGLKLAEAGGVGLYRGELLRVQALAAQHNAAQSGNGCVTLPNSALRFAMDLSIQQGTLIFAMRAAVALLRCSLDGMDRDGSHLLTDDVDQALMVLRHLLNDMQDGGQIVGRNRPVSAEIADAAAVLARAETASRQNAPYGTTA
jgi:AAA ATPase domain